MSIHPESSVSSNRSSFFNFLCWRRNRVHPEVSRIEELGRRILGNRPIVGEFGESTIHRNPNLERLLLNIEEDENQEIEEGGDQVHTDPVDARMAALSAQVSGNGHVGRSLTIRPEDWVNFTTQSWNNPELRLLPADIEEGSQIHSALQAEEILTRIENEGLAVFEAHRMIAQFEQSTLSKRIVIGRLSTIQEDLPIKSTGVSELESIFQEWARTPWRMPLHLRPLRANGVFAIKVDVDDTLHVL